MASADPANTFQTFAVPMRLAGVSQRHYVHGQYVETSVCTRSNATHEKIHITMQARISNSRVRLLRQSNREIGPTMDIPCSFSELWQGKVGKSFALFSFKIAVLVMPILLT